MKKTFIAFAVILVLAASYVFYLLNNEEMSIIMGWMNGRDIEVDLSGPRPQEDVSVIEKGRSIYERYCSICHGEKGDGRNKMAVNVRTLPRDFTGGMYRFRSTPTGSLPTDDDIFITISRGLRGTAMLPWLRLSSGEKWAVTYYIKSLSDRFLDEEPDDPVVIPEIPAPDNDLLARGRELYENAKCRECHGPLGEGDGPKALDLLDDRGQPITPGNFLKDPFKRGSLVEDTYLSLKTGLDGTPMASYGDTLTDEEIAALAVYVQSIADRRPPKSGKMLEPIPMTPDEIAGMMIYYPSIPPGMMRYGMIRK